MWANISTGSASLIASKRVNIRNGGTNTVWVSNNPAMTAGQGTSIAPGSIWVARTPGVKWYAIAAGGASRVLVTPMSGVSSSGSGFSVRSRGKRR